MSTHLPSPRWLTSLIILCLVAFVSVASQVAADAPPPALGCGNAVQIADEVPSEPDGLSLGEATRFVFRTFITPFTYQGGTVILTTCPDGSCTIVADDAVKLTVTHPDGTAWERAFDFYAVDFPPEDVSAGFMPGVNQVKVELIDLMGPVRGSPRPFYLVTRDTIAPVISNVIWRQNGQGSTIVMATITDNVGLAGASLWWNSQEFPMQSMGASRYYAIVPNQLNGVIGRFSITAVDGCGNISAWENGVLRVLYRNYAGLMRNTGKMGEPVNSATGSFYTQHRDLFAPAPGMPFEFKRTYDSLNAGLDGPLGFGWTHTYNTYLEVVDDPLLHGVVLTYADGRTANFETDGSGYRSPPGDHNILTHEASGFVLLRPDQVKYHYDSGGKLTSVEDRNGNRVQLAYTGDNLTQMTDPAGRVYHLAYSSAHITKITDVLGRSYEYTYDGAGNLITYQDPKGGHLQYTYDAEHWLLSITDPNGHVFVTNTYDERGRVIEQRDASGSLSTIGYPDEQHRVFTDNEGHATSHTYDARLRLVEDKDALGYNLTYQYDSDDNVARLTDRGGHATAYTYDSRGNLLTRQDALGQTAAFQYDTQNNVVYQRDEAGAETTYTYDAHGNRTHAHDAEGGDTAMTYEGRGLLLTLTDAQGHATQYAYDSEGNRVSATDVLGNVTRYAYDVMGRQTAITDANGHTVQFSYDGNDRQTAITDAKGNTTHFGYDGVGNLLSVTDRRGFTTTYTYNENDSLVKQTDPRGFASTFTYERMYHRTSATDGRGNTTRYEYDAVYNRIKVIDAKGNPTLFTYDGDRNLTALTDALGQATSYERDALHRVVKLTNALSGVTENTYDAVGRLTWLQDPKGGVTQFAYDRLGRRVRLTDALTNVTVYGYDAVGNRTAFTNARGFATQYAYNEVNRLTRQVDPLGYTLGWSYDGVGNIIGSTDSRGNATLFVYDANDNLVQTTDALNGVVRYTYDEEDHQLTRTDQNGNTTTTAYDQSGNRVKVILPLGQASNFEYDANNNLVAVINAKGKTTRFAYDPLNLVTTQTNPLGFVTTHTYDPLGRLTQVKDAEGNSTQYSYDALDRLVQVLDALNGKTGYEYDALGNLTAQTDANGHRTTFDVDLLGRTTRETNPLGNAWQYQYDPVGNRVQRTDAKGVVTQYTFDADDRLTRTAYPASPAVDLSYDENSNLVRVSDGSGAAAYAYDALNRLTQATRTAGILAGKSLTYGYDSVGNRLRITYPDGKAVSYAYNANNWLSTVTDPLAGAAQYTYDPVGLPTRLQYPNGTWADCTYDDADRLIRLFNGKPEASSNLIGSFDYTLDKVGNRVRTVEKATRGSVVTWTKDYTYDPLYRLLNAVETPDYNPAQPLKSAFTYDAVGNRLSMTTNIQDAPNTPPQPQMVTTGYTYNAANQMLTAGATQFTYDANGNRVGLRGPNSAATYSYDMENRLSGAQTFKVTRGSLKPDATLDYTYDGLGRRVQRGVVDNGVRKTASFLYDGQGYDMLAQYVTPSAPVITYYYRDLARVLSRHEIQGNGTGLQYFHHYDGLGSVSAWTNQSGRAVQSYRYAPYGRLLDNNGPDNASNATDPHNSLTFSGKPWDQETELYAFGARDYDPTTGTWLTQDIYRGQRTDPASLHRYMYANDNPATLVDRYGFSTSVLNPLLLDLDSPVAGSSAQLRSSSAAYSTSRTALTLNPLYSNAALKSMSGGSKFSWYPQLDLDYRIAGPSANFDIDAGGCIFGCNFWLWLDKLSNEHDRAIRTTATVIGFIPIAGGFWEQDILYATGKITSQKEFAIRQGFNVPLAALDLFGAGKIGKLGSLPKLTPAFKTVAKLDVNLGRELTLFSFGVTPREDLLKNMGDELIKAPFDYAGDVVGERMFPRGPGRTPVIGGNWSGSVGRAIIGQELTGVAGAGLGEVTTRIGPSLTTGILDDDMAQESAQLRR